MSCKILSVGAKEGKTPLVVITALTDEKRIKYIVTEGTYREIGCPLSGEEIDENSLYILASEDEKRRALLKSLNILSYADNNRRNLFSKLLRAGFSKDAIEYAVRECIALGYIDEARQAQRLILKHAAELLGPHKIKAKLVARSYSPALISKTMHELEMLGEIDFKENKEKLISLKLDEGSSYEEKMKLLFKYGYIR